MDIGPSEWIIIGCVLLLVFGSSKIPQLARSLGRAQNEFKKGLADGDAEPEDASVPTSDAPAGVTGSSDDRSAPVSAARPGAVGEQAG